MKIDLDLTSENASPSRPHDHIRRTKVLVIIPSLERGGAEMDLVRILPRLDRRKFEYSIFTFLKRGVPIIKPASPLPRVTKWTWACDAATHIG